MSELSIVNNQTGESIVGRVAIIPTKKKSPFGKDFLVMSQHAILEILKMKNDGKITGRDFDVLMFCATILDYENLVQLPYRIIEDQLGIKKPHISRSMKKLVELEILIEGPKIGQSKTYKLNPGIAWKGSSKNHKKAIIDFNKEKQLREKKKRELEPGATFRCPNTGDFFDDK